MKLCKHFLGLTAFITLAKFAAFAQKDLLSGTVQPASKEPIFNNSSGKQGVQDKRPFFPPAILDFFSKAIRSRSPMLMSKWSDRKGRRVKIRAEDYSHFRTNQRNWATER